MRALTSPAIILRSMPLGESDLLVSFLTRDQGRLRGIAKGARRSRQRFVNCLEVLALISLEYEPRGEGKPCFLHSGKLLDAHPGIRRDFTRLSTASYLVELTEVLFPTGVAEQEVFDLLRAALGMLAEGAKPVSARVAFELRAMALGGYAIRFEACSECRRVYKGEGRAVFKPDKGGIACLGCQPEGAGTPGVSIETAGVIQLCQSTPWNGLAGLELTDEVVTEVDRVLRLHREYHLGKKLKSAAYLE